MINRLRKAYQAFTKSSSDPKLLLELIAAMDDQINKINNTNAAILGIVENDINTQIDAIRLELKTLADGLKSLAELSAQRHVGVTDEIITNREATSQKLHALSNHVMSLAGKIDELAELIMLERNE